MKIYIDEETLNILLADKADNDKVETIQTILNKQKIENWVFTLEDGSTITKQVVTN